MKERRARIDRKTEETEVSLELLLDGTGICRVSTGIGFLDHLFSALAVHARFDLDLSCKGDLRVDDHHSAEDCSIAFGQALDVALGERRGIERFGFAFAPLDESLARAVVDFSGRPFSSVDLGLEGEFLGELSSQNASHVLSSIGLNAGASLHVDVLRGSNDHHRAEAAFKAFALALRAATRRSGFDDLRSTKGELSASPLRDKSG